MFLFRNLAKKAKRLWDEYLVPFIKLFFRACKDKRDSGIVEYYVDTPPDY